MEIATFLEMAKNTREVRVVVQGSGEEVRTGSSRLAPRSLFVHTGSKGRWYQHVLAKRTFPIEIEGTDVVVSVEPVTTAATNDDVSAAYKAKYPDEPETPEMVSSPVVATTLQLVPTEE